MIASARLLVLSFITTLVVFGGPPQTFSKCDINQDGSTNSVDVQAILNEALGVTTAVHDLNADGVVNVLDVQIVINAAAGAGCAADSATPPTIGDFNPKTGPVGTQVTVTGSNFGSSLQVTMPKQGGGSTVQPVSTLSPSSVTFVLAPGTATGPITLANGNAGNSTSSAFTVTPASTFTVSASPPAANLIQGQSVTYSVQLDSSNGFSQLASLGVTGVPAGITMSFKPSSISAGQNSLLTLTAPSNQPLTISANLSLTASSTVDGIAVSQTTPLTLSVVGPTTSFVGRTVVSDSIETPLAGVTISTMGLDGSGNTTGCTSHTVVSDASGNFALTNLPSSCIGPQLIRFDGTSTTSPPGKYAGVDLVFTLVSGQVVVSPVLVHMPRIDTAETFMVQQNSNVDQTYVFQSIPGLQATVYAGTILTNFDGTQPNPFPLTAIQVPVDRLPDQMPLTNSMVTAFIVAFQPANTTASKAVAVWFPNTLNTPPGTDVPLMTLDPTRGRMVAYGTGTVSNDGTTIIPDIDPSTGSLQHRFGIVHFDWHGPAVAPPPGVNPTPDGSSPEGGEPIDLASGVDVLVSADMFLGGNRGSLSIMRTYRTLSGQLGPFGIGSFHNYEFRLDTTAPQNAQIVNLALPSGARIPFTRLGGTLTNSTIPMMRGVVMTTASDGTTTVRWKTGETYTFVPGNFITGSVLVAITDANANVITIVRPPGNPQQISEIDDPAGRALKFTYDGTNRITSITDPIGRQVSYTYNSAGTLASFTNVLGGVTQYLYDSQNRITKITDPRGVVTAQNRYDSNGRVMQQTLASGGTFTYSYTLSNTLVPTSPVVQTQMTDARGNVTTYRFNTAGYVLSVTDGTGQVKSFDRQLGTNLILGVHGTGVCPVCGPAGIGDFTYTYDANGNRLTATDALGNTTTFTYEPLFNNITSVRDPLGNVTQMVYDSHGNLTSLTDAKNHETEFYYSPTGLMTKAEGYFADNASTLFTYDAIGNLISTVDALGQTWRRSYDGASRLIAKMDPQGSVESYAYNALNQRVSQTDGNGHTTNLTYDTAGFLKSFTDPRGSVNYSYDGAGRLSTRTDQLNRTDTYSYDLMNNIVGGQNRRGQQATFGYDALNRLVSEQHSDSQVQRTYDAAGRLIRVVDSASGTFSMVYDADGRLIASNQPFGTVNYTRDKNGRVTSRQVVGQPAETYTYDPDGNLNVLSMAGVTITETYNDRNLLQTVSRSNGITGTYAYDLLGRLLSIQEAPSSGPSLLNRTLSYDSAGRLSGKAEEVGAPLSTPAIASASYDAANGVTAFGSTTFTQDAAGNRLSDVSSAGTTSYTWDARGRLLSVVAPTGAVTSFIYDFRGVLLQRTSNVNGSITTQRYVLDDMTNIASIQTVGAGVQPIMTGRNVDEHLAVIANGSPTFALMDQIGSVVATADNSGNIVSRVEYDAYGQAAITGTAYPFLYAGRPQIVAGIYNDRNRNYDAVRGRFLSPDPADLSGGDSNLYRYVGGRPVDRTDPLGLDWLQTVSDFSAGFGDTISFGLTRWVRQQMGTDDVVNHCSGAYGAGQWAGYGFDIALAVATAGTSAELEEGAETGEVLLNAGNNARRFTPDQEALVDLAQQARRTGINQGDAQTLLDWADEVGLNARNDIGTNHWVGGDHIHIGPINHIPVR